jgi:hypothetical protein
MKNGAVVALALGGVMVAGCVTCGAGAAILDTAAQSGPTDPPPVTTPRESAPAAASPRSSTVPRQTARRTRPATVPKAFTTGEWLVGADIAPGRYESDGPDGDFMCYWQITTVPGAQPGDPGFVTNDVPPGHVYVDLKRGQYFSSTYCKSWAPVV